MAKSNLKNLNGCKREIELEIDAVEVKKEFEKILGQFTARSEIPGFRPGKAPRDIIRQKFYPEIKESLIDSLIPRVLAAELKAHNLNLVSTPVINEFRFEEGEPLRFKAQFEVWPEFKLPEYRNIKVRKKKISVSEDEINQSLEELRQRSADYVPVQGRGVVREDYVAVEIKGMDEKTKRFLPLEKGLIVAGHPENEKILNQNLLGLKAGDEKTFTISYDRGHPNKRLAGRTIIHSLKVVSIKEKKLPELSDEFAKDFGDFQSLKGLKDMIAKELTSSKEKAARSETAEQILNQISEKTSIELPEVLVEEERRAVLSRFLTSRPHQPLTAEEQEKLREESRKKAEKNLRNHLILKNIAQNENLSVSDEEIQEEFEQIAEANTIPLARVVESFNREGRREELRDSLLLKKTVDFLVENAIINY